MTFDEIIELFQQHANRPLSLKELQRDFDLSAGERKEIGKVLKELVKDGTLVQLKGGRFALPGKVNLVVGTIKVHRDGYAFVSPANKDTDDVFVPARHVRPAMDGDTVVVRVERSLHSRRPEGRVIRVERREHQSIVGCFRREHGLSYVSPVDPQLNEDVLIPPESTAGAEPGQMVVVSIESFPGDTAPQEHFLMENGFPLWHIKEPKEISRKAIDLLGTEPSKDRFTGAFKNKIDQFDNPTEILLQHVLEDLKT